MEIFRSMLHGLLPFSQVLLTGLCSFWYGLKDLFTLHKLSTKLSLTIKTDDVTSRRRDVDLPSSYGQLKGEWVKQRTSTRNESPSLLVATMLPNLYC